MSSQTISKSITLQLILLTLIPFYLQSQNAAVKADEALIISECHNADVPTSCVQCVTSDPNGMTADRVGIASIIIDCLINYADNLTSNMSTLASTTPDFAAKYAYGNCSEGYSYAKTELSHAAFRLKNGKYDHAEYSVSLAREQTLDECSVIDTYKEQLPTSVLYELRIYDELSNAADRIIERL